MRKKDNPGSQDQAEAPKGEPVKRTEVKAIIDAVATLRLIAHEIGLATLLECIDIIKDEQQADLDRK